MSADMATTADGRWEAARARGEAFMVTWRDDRGDNVHETVARVLDPRPVREGEEMGR